MDKIKYLERSIRTIPDFPKPGIMFCDVLPILKDSVASEMLVTKVANYIQEHHGKVGYCVRIIRAVAVALYFILPG